MILLNKCIRSFAGKKVMKPSENPVERKTSVERGQSLVEFAMVLPLLLLIALGVVEFGRAYYQYNTLTKAVREGARYMSIHAYDTDELARAKNMTVFGNREGTGSPCLPGLAVGNIAVTPRNPSSGTSPTNPPRWVKVSVTGYNFQPLFTKVVPIGNFAFNPSVEMRYVGLNARLDQ